MKSAEEQRKAGRVFVFEHPVRATSWDQPCVKKVAEMQGVQMVVADMCMFGLVSRVDRVPVRKRTRFMTNSPHMAAALAGHTCDRQHPHRRISGSEGGMLRSTAAQIYPPGLCECLAQGARDHVRAKR